MTEPYNWAEASHVRPTSYPAPIPVHERLPEFDCPVLTTEPYDDGSFAPWSLSLFFDGGFWHDGDGAPGWALTSITHWLPLPPAP
jgi:hypothetical protein